MISRMMLKSLRSAMSAMCRERRRTCFLNKGTTRRHLTTGSRAGTKVWSKSLKVILIQLGRPCHSYRCGSCQVGTSSHVSACDTKRTIDSCCRRSPESSQLIHGLSANYLLEVRYSSLSVSRYSRGSYIKIQFIN